MNAGEQLVADYLQYIKKCQFVQQNLPTTEEQGEIDVVGIDTNLKIIYICEVAIHLETGLQYTKGNQTNNVSKFIEKFERCNNYASVHWKGYQHIFMLWSPIIKSPKKEFSHSQLKDVKEIVEKLQIRGINIIPIINQDFMNCIEELKDYALTTSKELKSPIMRYMQIESKLKKHINKLNI